MPEISYRQQEAYGEKPGVKLVVKAYVGKIL